MHLYHSRAETYNAFQAFQARGDDAEAGTLSHCLSPRAGLARALPETLSTKLSLDRDGAVDSLNRKVSHNLSNP